ncbi:unnamed protein product [Onchocerca flexuosa]|uniref:Uncharacterized protein n=1 Tax=Onchocerca flexuosa TaxID=387005 RepID=A0A183HQF8_9BILA|nr:unnamed protein product [Onchocerca flexuosa]
MGYIIIRNIANDGNVLKPIILDAVLKLWNLIQEIKIEGERNDSTFDYASICVKFPTSPEFDEIVANILMHKSFRLHEECVSNPLITAFKMFVNGDLNPKNDTIDKAILKLVANSFSSDLLINICNFLGGITFDEKHQISGHAENFCLFFFLQFHLFSNVSISFLIFEFLKTDYILKLQLTMLYFKITD